LKKYRADPHGFSVSYQRQTPGKLSKEAEQAIQQELKREKDLVDDPELLITSYNYLCWLLGSSVQIGEVKQFSF
jgi:hypothetical protein